MDQKPPKESRPPINLRIKFRSETVEQFIERYAVDVSRGGIFIRTKDPLAVGTQLKLDFQFQNGGALMSGDGTVVWIRELDPNRGNVPPGMGVRFDRLTPESQAVLEQLLGEKAKRERGSVPGSGVGGLAVRRPSSMFSALEPQVSVETAAADNADTGDTGQSDTTSGSKASPGLAPLAGTSAPASRVGAPSSRPPTNPTAGGTSPASKFFGGTSSPRPSQRPTPTEETPFGNDEPTQIAGRIPSFLSTLSSEREAASALLRTGGAKPGLVDTGARASASESDRSEAQAADTATASATGGTEPWTDAAHTNDAPEPAHHTLPRNELLSPGPPPSKDTARDTARDLPAEGSGSATTGSASTSSAASRDQPSGADSGTPAGSAEAGSTPDVPTTAPSAAMAASPAATVAKPKGPQKRSSAALVGVSVLVLGAAALFLFRFFGSHSTEVVTAPRPSSGTAAMQEPATAPAVPAIAPIPAEPTAPAPAGAAPPAPADNAGRPAPTANDNAGSATTPTAAAATAGEVKPEDPAAAATRKVARHKPARATRDTSAAVVAPAEGKGAGEIAAAAPATATAPATAPPAVAAAAATIAAPTAAAPAVAEAPGHEIRITSKPVGADVALDGQTVGKTPSAIAIADVSAPHFITVRKEGFETFEQMISASSAWSKSKGAKGKPAVQVLKISAKLKQVGGGEARPSTEPAAPGGETPARSDVPRLDRPLPPSDERGPVGTP